MPLFRGLVSRFQLFVLFLLLLTFVSAGSALFAQAGNSGNIQGTVTDPSGAVIPKASVTLHNPVSGFTRSAQSDDAGQFAFANVPFNSYHLDVTAKGFGSASQSVDVRSLVAITLKIPLSLTGSQETVTVEASADLVENDPIGHTDVDRGLFEKIPLESSTSSVSSLVTLASPGVAADSNGMFHGMGDHASNSFSVDDQPITDQQSKVFSNQIPLDSVQSLEVIPGAPPAEYGGKTSLVIVATTRSGLNEVKPHGQVTSSYGSFGSADVGFNLAYGGAKWGNFISGSGSDSGRFLDAPEFSVMHDKGNEENFFDRVDYQPSAANSFRFNFGYTRSWFQTPNSYDSELATPWVGSGITVGPADQRSQIKTFNIAPTYTRIIDASTVFNLGGFVRRDAYNYYPSNDALADRGPVNLQQESISQNRTLANTGVRADITHTKGVNNVKIGATYQQTFLDENDHLGIVDPTLIPNLGCGTATNPVPGSACATLAPFDLTAGGGLYDFSGHTDIKEGAAYIQDSITAGNWSMNLGLRGDLYNGLTTARQLEPRVGMAYQIKKTGTALRLSYARTLESPFNENLILASEGCNSAVIAALIPCVTSPNAPGQRNDFHAGFQQAFGHFAVFSGDYVWKYTHNAYDFSVLGATPITFPIGWHNSKIPGLDGRLSIPENHGFSALVVFSSVAARFFTPQTSGLGTVPVPAGTAANIPFRIDHDEKFNQTTHLQYQFNKKTPWVGLNWRFDSGQVAGAVPFATDTTTPVDLTGLTADQQMQAGLVCGGDRPTLTTPLTTCAPSQYSSTLLSIPAPGTENDDHNPPRVSSRSLFDLALGQDNVFHRDKHTVSARVTVVNLSDKFALYNFLSTFSGTHFVSPRSVTAEVGFHF
jgi:hypothetical protein